MPKTGEINTVSGIYKSSGCQHDVERAIPENHKFPPCEHCHHAVTWTLVRRTDTK